MGAVVSVLVALLLIPSQRKMPVTDGHPVYPVARVAGPEKATRIPVRIRRRAPLCGQLQSRLDANPLEWL